MAYLSFYTLLVIDFFVFFSFIGLGVVILIIGKYYSYKRKLSVAWVLLSIGIIISAFRSLFDIIVLANTDLGVITEVGSPVSGLGSLVMIVGLASLLVEKTMESGSLLKRSEELKLVIEYLNQKYMKRQLTEEDLRKMTSELTKELAEIEVKLKELK